VSLVPRSWCSAWGLVLGASCGAGCLVRRWVPRAVLGASCGVWDSCACALTRATRSAAAALRPGQVCFWRIT